MRLRQQIDRSRRHPVLGPLLIILLVLMIALMMLHEGSESTGLDLGALCVGIMLALLRLVVPRPTTPESRPTPEAKAARAPPRRACRLGMPTGFGASRSLPLRL